MKQVEALLEDGRRCLGKGDILGAAQAAWEAYDLRKLEPSVWQLLEKVAWAEGDVFAMGFWMGLRAKKLGTGIQAPAELENVDELLRGVGYALSHPQFAPYHKSIVRREISLDTQQDVVLGDCLPAETTGVPGYFVGVYNPQNRRDVRARLAEAYRASHLDIADYGDFTYDLMHAESVQDVTLSPDAGERYLQPIAGVEAGQPLIVELGNGQHGTLSLSKYETTFLRVQEPMRLSSEMSFWLGTPILLQHSSKRRKVVLNLLTDGLSWGEQKKEGYANIPNIMKFFSEGVIFDDAYSGSEYTYPSLATIETGMLPTSSQIFSTDAITRLGANHRTLSEQMKQLGYYCVNLMSDGEGIYNGVTRGYDRMIVNHYMQPTYKAVERTIQHLEAFGEADQFLFVHLADSHPYNSDIRCLESVQTQLPPEEFFNAPPETTSVFLQATHRNQLLNQQNIRNMDRQLGMLFDYLTTHYKEDELLVCLYADHGCSIYSEKPWLLSSMHSNSALMVRGGGIPRGVRADELMSTADIYAILGHVCGFPIDALQLDSNLPEVFGGKRRDIVVSQSIFAGQTRKICLRTEQYACRFETEAFTQVDGTVDASSYTIRVFRREGEEDVEVTDNAVRQAFHSYLKHHAEKFMLEGWE